VANHRFSHKTPWNPEGKQTVGIVRYGAYGDTIQAASVAAAFKKGGYHVTLFASYPSSELVALDPNIDDLVVQLQDQIPMQWLGYYWIWLQKYWKGKGFNRWVNLTESIEGNLLAVAGNVKFEWNPMGRHRVMNFNYWQHQFELAGLVYEIPTTRFHPSEEERGWAAQERQRMEKAGIKRFVLWALAGSSRGHKIYPYQDAVWKHLFKYYQEWGVVTVGDGSCADLEKGFEGEPRLWRTSGKWNIRQVCAMLELADVVVGPETGTLSIAAFYPMPKIALLSHSTIENLTRDWTNTTSLWAPTTECPGRGRNIVPACHKMLASFEGCRQHSEAGTAQCVAEIKPEWVWEVLQRAMNEGSGGDWSPPVAEATVLGA
jgi:ADP-heptose:LPS heptosyltransferase